MQVLHLWGKFCINTMTWGIVDRSGVLIELGTKSAHHLILAFLKLRVKSNSPLLDLVQGCLDVLQLRCLQAKECLLLFLFSVLLCFLYQFIKCMLIRFDNLVMLVKHLDFRVLLIEEGEGLSILFFKVLSNFVSH